MSETDRPILPTGDPFSRFMSDAIKTHDLRDTRGYVEGQHDVAELFYDARRDLYYAWFRESGFRAVSRFLYESVAHAWYREKNAQ